MLASRRRVLEGLCGGAALAWGLPDGARAADLDVRFIDAPWSGIGDAARRGEEASRRLEIPAPPSVAASWRENAELAHLATSAEAAGLLDTPADSAARRFKLSAATLSALMQANAFEGVISDDPVVLFALRGCVIEDSDIVGRSVEAVDLRVIRPDNLAPRCVIGVWLRTQHRLAVFQASTVPNRHALMLQVAAFSRAGGAGRPVWRLANTLASGLHRFSPGRHGGWHPAALRAADQRGRALRQPALRSTGGLLSLSEVRLDMAVVMDNIHPGLTPADPHGAAFSSEGCLTLCERDPPAHWSVDPPDWTTFSQLAGFGRGARRRELKLALLPGVEAWAAATWGAIPRLRYGSGGPAMAALRRSLGLARAGDFDAEVLRRVMAAGAGSVVPPDAG